MRSSIQFILTVSFSLFSVAVIAMFGLLLYDKFSQTEEQSAILSTQQIVEQVSYNLEDYVRSITDVFRVIDQTIQAGGGAQSDTVASELKAILRTREDIVSLALFTEQGELIESMPRQQVRNSMRLTDQSWFKSATDTPGHLSFSLPHIQNIYHGSYRWVVSMSKGITIKQNGVTQNAVLLVDVNFKQIDELSQRVSLGQKGYVYIIDDSAGNIVYHPQQQLIYIGLKYENVEQALKYAYGSYMDDSTGEDRLITIKTVNNIGWKVVGVSYMDEVMTSKQEVGDYIVRILLLVLLLVLIISAFMSARISRPIKQLEKAMKSVERGEFGTPVTIRGALEVERLSQRYNMMMGTIKQLMNQIVAEQEAKRKYELEVLQAQINPHFLYNTLNSVVRMVGMSKNEEIVKTITSLSKLFRISLGKGQAIITVKEELEHARNYLTIQEIRFKNKFHFTLEADDEVLGFRTLKLILQPIIENAIVHGIERMVDEGYIEVRAQLIGERVRFTIKDNGLGIDEKTLQKLNSGQAVGTSEPILQGSGSGSGAMPVSSGSGVGVHNVRERIRLYYGEEYGLTYESELEEGTTVTIEIPRRIGTGDKKEVDV
ncbi:two-component system sensor histidine kinase YesM [Paenibacillus phyllosphaerae]|uniref:histidine kinase n=1 Tax=Paenibacillus phyllosphaerae TaxID=274593 RepID=A0A7W5B1E4_9BACL|nr:sensor histidine kinase [Paenibacillus phyllosphaerae]MBB3112655.1 two-component system sensor histidine kinase YesM [Paenibacillus phyllosphaerae]